MLCSVPIKRTELPNIHKLIHSIRNKNELPEKWKDSITALIDKNGVTMECNHYRRTSPLLTAYKIVSNAFLSKLIWYVHEVTADGLGCNTATADHVFCIRQILEKKWEYKEAVHQLFVTNKTVCNSVWREALFNTVGRFVMTTINYNTKKSSLDTNRIRCLTGE